jgi:uncharacterized protein YukE
MTPWYRKQWTGGLFGRYEAPTARKDLIQQLLTEINCLRAGWEGTQDQHDALLERYRGLSKEMNELNMQLEQVYNQRDKAIRKFEQLQVNSFYYDLSLWFLGVSIGALASFTVSWVLWA